MPDRNSSMSLLTIGRSHASQEGEVVDGEPNSVPEISTLGSDPVEANAHLPRRYDKKPNYGPFGIDDFQIGSVRLTAPPVAVSVERLRDVQTTPIIRGQALSTKASASVVQLNLVLEFGDPDHLNEELRPLLAEIKTCPFLKLRSYDLALKMSGIEGFEVSENLAVLQQNILDAEAARAKIQGLLAHMFTEVRDDLGATIQNQRWQNEIAIMISKELDRAVNTGLNLATRNNMNTMYATEASTAAEGVMNNISTILRKYHNVVVNTLGSGSVRFLIHNYYRPHRFDDPLLAAAGVSYDDVDQDKVEDRIKLLRLQFETLITSAHRQRSLEQVTHDENARIPLMDGFVPVVCQQVVVQSIPDRSGAFQANFTFEYFFHTNYVDELLYHSYNDRTNQWDYSPDPAASDFLLRWRDFQYLDDSTTRLIRPEQQPNTVLHNLNYRGRDHSKLPGFIEYMQRASNTRGNAPFSSTLTDHKLNLFYPVAFPRLQAAPEDVNTNAQYKLAEIDNTRADSPGITCGVQVVWNLNIARHIDEHHGVVRHQWAGGSVLEASFEVCVPIDELPEDIMSDGPLTEQSYKDNGYVRAITSLNHMFTTMEQNRKFLPSDAFVPTTVFIQNPVTALFGAYCFELNDIPMFQSTPGSATTVINVVEALPVIGGLTFDIESTSHIHPTPKDLGADFGYRLTAAVAKDFEPARTLILDRILALDTRERPKSGAPRTATLFEEAIERLIGVNYKDLSDTGYEAFIRDVLYFLVGIQPSNILESASYIRSVFDANLALSNGDTEAERRLNVIRKFLHLDENYTPHITVSTALDLLNAYIGHASSYVDSDRITEILQELNISTEGKDPVIALVEAIQDMHQDNDVVDAVLTEQLYPDMTLPTYAQIFGIPESEIEDSENAVPPDRWLQWIPSMAEVGKLDPGRQEHALPSRRLRDIVDPDIYFKRETRLMDSAVQRGLNIENDVPETDGDGNRDEFLSSIPADENTTEVQSVAAMPSSSVRRVTNSGRDDSTGVLANSWAELETSIMPNERRMLYAFPTYAMEFFLDIEHSEIDPHSGIVIPDTDAHFEARMFNVLPLIDLEIYEDARDRPNIANIQFVARRAGLRNASWKFLPPKNPLTVNRADSRLQFTNDVDKVVRHLNQHTRYQTEPMFMTETLFSNGSRCVVKIGYGTDLNNPRMLPTKISGTIGEFALGEVSNMVVQSFGTQLANPINTRIGGSGRYNPNHRLSGAYTMQALSDLFHAMDARFMGRTGRGIDIDARTLTNRDLRRISLLAYQTRTALGNLARGTIGYLQGADWIDSWWGVTLSIVGAGIFPIGAVTTPTRIGRWLVGDGEEEGFFEDLRTGVLNPYRNFTPELLNCIGPPTGISDWAMSNTDTKNLPAAAWVDMISRLNAGTIWWPHTYGDEVRLFWGRPEAVFRADPGIFNTETSNALLNFVDNYMTVSASKLTESFSSLLSVGDRASERVSQMPERTKELHDLYDLSVPFDIIIPTSERALHKHSEFLRSNGLHNSAIGLFYRDLFIDNLRRLNIGTLDRDYREIPRNRVKNMLESDVLFNSIFLSSENFTSFLDKLSSLNIPDLDQGTVVDRLGVVTSPVKSDEDRKTYVLNADALRLLYRVANLVSEDLKYLYENQDIGSNKIATSLEEPANKLAVDSLNALRLMRMNGYRRFRSNHFAYTGHKLMSSTLEATQAYMANSVSYNGWVVGYNVLPEERRVADLDSEMAKLNFGIFEWAKGLIGKTDKERVVDVLFPGQLARGMSKMYRGELVLIGDPYIKPHDVIYTMDLYNGIYGPVACETVINKLSVRTGLMTIVRPCALTDHHSSSYLTDQTVHHRMAKVLAGGLLLTGIGAAVLGGPVGWVAGGVLAIGAAGSATYASIFEMYARQRLETVSTLDPFLGSALSGKDTTEVEKIINTMMLDTFVPSMRLETSGMAEGKSALLERLNAAGANRDIAGVAELGVTMWPLKRLTTQIPYVAGLRSSRFQTVEIPAISSILLDDFEFHPFDPAITYLSDMWIVVQRTWQDYHLGLDYIRDSVAAKANEMRRLSELLRERGIVLEDE
jgi:hypothetical protein